MNENAALSEELMVDAGARQTNLTRRLFDSNHLAIVLVLAITFVAYVGTISYQFVYDDIGQIVENPVHQVMGLRAALLHRAYLGTPGAGRSRKLLSPGLHDLDVRQLHVIRT